jgi:hypothetical protein
MRSAEKKRTSTCSFADEIARISIEEYHRLCPDALLGSYKQTVLSTILCENLDDHSLKIISFGVGTKYMKYHFVDHKTNKLSQQHLKCLRDCHAEILARRGFLCYLYREIEILFQSVLLSIQNNPYFDLSTIHTSLLEFEIPSLPMKRNSDRESKLSQVRVKLRNNIRIHLYTSSAPCGNSCIKRWAKGQTIKTLELSPTEYPAQPHPRLHVTAPQEGQVAVLTKKRSGIDVRYVTDEINLLSLRHQRISSILCQLSPPTTAYIYTPPPYPTEYLPLGTSHPPPYPLHSDKPISGLSMTCSDKITTWNAVGLQGSLLSHLFSKPIYLTSITIGRKYSVPHVYRGLCCRVQDFQYPQISPVYLCNHPVILCTALKLDEGAIITASPVSPHPSSDTNTDSTLTEESSHIGANFEDVRCLCFSRAIDSTLDHHPDLSLNSDCSTSIFEVIDGESGMLFCDDEQLVTAPQSSSFCSLNLFERYVRCERLREALIRMMLSCSENEEVDDSPAPLDLKRDSGENGEIEIEEYLLVKTLGFPQTRNVIDRSDEEMPPVPVVDPSVVGSSCYRDAKHALLTAKKYNLKGWVRTTTLLRDGQSQSQGGVDTEQLVPSEEKNLKECGNALQSELI